MDYQFLTKTKLFQGIEEKDMKSMFACFSCKTKSYKKGDYIYHAGTKIKALGLVLSGSVTIENNDVWGNHSILDCVTPGRIFAETYALCPNEILLVDIVANEPTEILFLDTTTATTTCCNACSCHQALIRNLLQISSRKNLNLSRHIMHTSSKTIRGRLLSYLSFQAQKQGSYEFDIPFNRQQLADYLGLDRSALSSELGKMQRDGLITFRKNHFTLSSDFDLY